MMGPAVSAQAWVRSRIGTWNEWLAQSSTRPAAAAQDLTLEQARHMVEQHRALARDLATARRLLPKSRTTAALEALYLRSHVQIDRAPRVTRAALLHLAREEIPAVMASLLPTILWIVALLLASVGAGWWLITRYPELISLIASPSMIDQVEHGHLWTSDLFNIVPSSMLSLRILSNNITVTLMMFCSGIFLGLGVAYFSALNGLMLGALLAFTHQHGLAGALLTFATAHGPVELSTMCIAGAAGIKLGESVLRPTLPSRRESFESCARRLGPVLGSCALLLIGCGIIEGFVSPDPRVPLAVRLAIGIGWWALMLAFFSGRLFAWTTVRLQAPAQ
ncbi:MAG TPA: stage II sporulation protein M [Steroidobacteraceae bacterium]|nr:stage II sporulation protein M [Steroidobacteraceae bacterium]